MTFPEIIGTLGVLITLIAYFYLQIGKLRAENPWYSFLNALGALLILCSLYYEWNLASCLMEGTWLLLSLYGWVKSLVEKRKKRAHH